jgi:hypothetical protein
MATSVGAAVLVNNRRPVTSGIMRVGAGIGIGSEVHVGSGGKVEFVKLFGSTVASSFGPTLWAWFAPFRIVCEGRSAVGLMVG